MKTEHRENLSLRRAASWKQISNSCSDCANVGKYTKTSSTHLWTEKHQVGLSSHGSTEKSPMWYASQTEEAGVQQEPPVNQRSSHQRDTKAIFARRSSLSMFVTTLVSTAVWSYATAEVIHSRRPLDMKPTIVHAQRTQSMTSSSSTQEHHEIA